MGRKAHRSRAALVDPQGEHKIRACGDIAAHVFDIPLRELQVEGRDTSVEVHVERVMMPEEVYGIDTTKQGVGRCMGGNIGTYPKTVAGDAQLQTPICLRPQKHKVLSRQFGHGPRGVLVQRILGRVPRRFASAGREAIAKREEDLSVTGVLRMRAVRFRVESLCQAEAVRCGRPGTWKPSLEV